MEIAEPNVNPHALEAARGNDLSAASIPQENPEVAQDTWVLPACFFKREDGLYVDAARAALDTQFARFIDRVFAERAYFCQLDYVALSGLLYQDSSWDNKKADRIKLADRIMAFPEARRALYTRVEIFGEGQGATYLFEPVFMQTSSDADAPEQANPAPPEPTKLTVDEFVAHLWVLGIRAGIDDKTVRRVIAKEEMGRIEVAHWLAPTTGQDASIQEISDALHRDNSPKQLANGHIDLGQFKNRYPQIAKNAALLKKTPRVLGQAGRKITGEVVEPDMPKDFDFKALAGIGTQVEQRADGEYIVSIVDGFLSLDSATNQVSINAKIISHEGVSMRTTGDLKLTGDDYEEHGEVEELRTVEGKNMTFCANVYGSLISRGGVITLKENFSKGHVSNPQGKIIVEGRASSVVIDAAGGDIHIRTAEGCTITGKKVSVESAVRCQIVAEELELGTAEGCAVAAKTVKIGSAAARKDVETVVSVLIPDFAALEKQRSELKKQIADSQKVQQRSMKELDALRAQPEFAHFLALQAKITRGEIKLSAQQQDAFKKAASRFTSQLHQLRHLTDDTAPAQKVIDHAEQQLRDMAEQETSCAQGIRCDIEAIMGETIVRTMRIKFDKEALAGATPQELALKLRNLGEPNERLFSGRSGAFGWVYATPQPEVES